MKPLIGITADIDDGSRFARRYAGKKIVHLWSAYLEAVLEAGGAAVLLAPLSHLEHLDLMLGKLDGILLTGSASDVPPSFYGEKIIKAAHVAPKPERAKFEKELVLRAARLGLPMLGICGGEQIINVAFEGSLFQDITLQCQTPICHESGGSSAQNMHEVEIEPETRLARLLFAKPPKKKTRITVNSSHHQAVKKLGRGLRLSAKARDGIIEGIEAEKGFIIGVQWHPERLYRQKPEQYRLLRQFLKECAKT
jgi:putative glutamine amidotransferase